jgi:pimeloyl-ACP methyl ester carboxylesterase
MLRALAILAGIVALGVIAALIAFLRWRTRTRQHLLSASTVVHTARGPIDCAFAGPEDAAPVLVLHGGLGGWDQGIALAEDLGLTSSFRVIAPSRPGYLRTPLDAGRSSEAAAGAMIALLDALNIKQAAVVGISAGGPTAIALATNHPERVRALAMVCAVSSRHVQPGITADSLFGRILFSNAVTWALDLFSWVALQLMSIAPAFMTRRILMMTELGSRAEIRRRVERLRATDPARLQWVKRLLEISFPIGPRREGLRNDLAVFAAMPDRISARITCPTLVIHGKLDGNVPIEQAEVVCRVAENLQRFIIDDASHLLWLNPRIDEVCARLHAFLHRS